MRQVIEGHVSPVRRHQLFQHSGLAHLARAREQNNRILSGQVQYRPFHISFDVRHRHTFFIRFIRFIGQFHAAL
jgi:hypothetical protein